MDDLLSYYQGRQVVVTGCASGIGGATAQKLFAGGAHVIGLDRNAPAQGVHEFLEVDLGDLDSITATAAKISGPVWGLFNCAGLSGGASDAQHVLRVNFLGLRAFLEAMLDRIPEGGAIANVASGAARAWRENMDIVIELARTQGFAEGAAWAEKHDAFVQEHGGYPTSKEALVLYTYGRCIELGGRGIRINTTGPGVTDTPMLIDSAKAHGADFIDRVPKALGRVSTAEEQANLLIYLNSDWASYVSGQMIWSDGGNINAGVLPA
jgi:NAD(P)-dependent dehydrogenase (short-subunit alcohol dehydrogenase family)